MFSLPGVLVRGRRPASRDDPPPARRRGGAVGGEKGDEDDRSEDGDEDIECLPPLPGVLLGALSSLGLSPLCACPRVPFTLSP